MEFISSYLRAIDIIALIALVILAIAAFYRRESFWLWLLGIVVLVWALIRVFGLL